MPTVRSSDQTRLPSPGAAILAIGVNNLDHFASFIQQGGLPERYGEWLKFRFNYCERIRSGFRDRKNRFQIITHIDDINLEEASDRQTGSAEYAENSQEAADPYEGYYGSEKD